jgi:hypothetical protein
VRNASRKDGNHFGMAFAPLPKGARSNSRKLGSRSCRGARGPHSDGHLNRQASRGPCAALRQRGVRTATLGRIRDSGVSRAFLDRKALVRLLCDTEAVSFSTDTSSKSSRTLPAPRVSFRRSRWHVSIRPVPRLDQVRNRATVARKENAARRGRGDSSRSAACISGFDQKVAPSINVPTRTNSQLYAGDL